MITSREMADELTLMFQEALFVNLTGSKYIHPDSELCAYITVDVILELDVKWMDKSIVADYPKIYKPEQTIEFWQEVKEILEEIKPI